MMSDVSIHAANIAAEGQGGSGSARRRNLLAACLAHVVHDGYTDGLYAFLPIWQAQFGLSYAGLAMIRALYYGTMGALQTPADRVTRRLSARIALVLATLVAAGGFGLMALPFGYAGLCAGLVLAGIGSSIQHPRGSLLVSETFGEEARRPLSVYNFAGDLGKAALPALIALLLPILAWRTVTAALAGLGVAAALALYNLAPVADGAQAKAKNGSAVRGRSGFGILMIIGALDTATRMGYLLFLPFLIHDRGGSAAIGGLALALLFAGGALGKATCGWLGERFGVIGAVVATETATAALIIASLFTPLGPTLALLPVLGVFLNGTSSVLYGTVPELAPRADVGRAFALFYTGVIGAGGLAPIAYGALADHTSRTIGLIATAATAAAIAPLVLRLRRSLVSHP